MSIREDFLINDSKKNVNYLGDNAARAMTITKQLNNVWLIIQAPKDGHLLFKLQSALLLCEPGDICHPLHHNIGQPIFLFLSTKKKKKKIRKKKKIENRKVIKGFTAWRFESINFALKILGIPLLVNGSKISKWV